MNNRKISKALETKLKYSKNSRRFANILDNRYRGIKPFKEESLYLYDNECKIIDDSVGYPDDIYHNTKTNTVYITERKKLSNWKHALGQLITYKIALGETYKCTHPNNEPKIIAKLELICDNKMYYDNKKYKPIEKCGHYANIEKICKIYDIKYEIIALGDNKMLNWRLYLDTDIIINKLKSKGLFDNFDTNNLDIYEIYNLSQILTLDDMTDNDINTILKNRGTTPSDSSLDNINYINTRYNSPGKKNKQDVLIKGAKRYLAENKLYKTNYDELVNDIALINSDYDIYGKLNELKNMDNDQFFMETNKTNKFKGTREERMRQIESILLRHI